MRRFNLPLCLLFALGAGCQNGQIFAPSDSDDDGADSPAGGSAPGGNPGGGGADDQPDWREPASCGDLDADRTPVRLLSRLEYNNTVADLVGDTSAPLDRSPSASQPGFDNDALALSVSPALLERYVEIADEVAARAVADRAATGLVPCDPAVDGDRACAEEVVRTFGLRAYRRPLDADEEAALLALWDLGAADGGFEAGLQLVVEAALQSPSFLYHVEAGEDPAHAGAAPLTGYELASRLSYFLWNTMPDQALFDAAARGDLATTDGIRAQVDRMLDDPRARGGVRHFHEQWLHLDLLDSATKAADRFPGFDAVRDDLREETLAFLDELVFGGGDVDGIFLSPFTMMNDPLAEFYGVAAPGTGETFTRVPLDGTTRAGLLTQGSLLAANAKSRRTSPIHRGLFVRTQILCQSLPAPPPGIPTLSDEDVGATERERLQQHREDPACSGCHELMDPIGFAFESYDAAGQWREIGEDGRPVDDSGEIVSTRDADGTLDGAIELSERLAGSREVRECVAEQWFRYALARAPGEHDACAMQQLMERFEASDWRLRDLIVEIALSDAFRFRRGEETGGECR